MASSQTMNNESRSRARAAISILRGSHGNVYVIFQKHYTRNYHLCFSSSADGWSTQAPEMEYGRRHLYDFFKLNKYEK